MAKSPGRAALDEALQETLTPGLKARGFRKRGLNWSFQDGDRELLVEIESSRQQFPGDGAWRLYVRWALPTSSDSPRRRKGITRLADLRRGGAYDWLYLNSSNYTDAALLARADLRIVAWDWEQHIAPMLDAATDVASLVKFLLPRSDQVLSAGNLVGHALESGEDELVVAALENLASVLKAAQYERGSEWKPENRFEGFWGFFQEIDQVEVGPRAQEILRSFLDGLDRPESEMAQRWFDPIATAAGRG